MFSQIIEKKKIIERDYDLSGERYTEELFNTNLKWPLVSIGKLCVVERGASPRPIHDFITTAANGINWIKIGDAKVGEKFITKTKERITPEGASKSRFVKPGDFILSNSMSFGRPYIMATEGCIHDGWLLLRDQSDLLDKDFLYNILGSRLVFAQFEKAATGGVVNNLNSELVRNVQIPLPPLEVQTEIVAEIERYQRVMDGARAVIACYKPYIPNNPAWPMTELGKVCEVIMDGTHFSPSNTEKGKRLYITSKNVRENYLDLSDVSYISEENHKSIYARCPVKPGDVLYIKDGANTGLASINTLKEEFSLLSSVAVMRGKPGVLDNHYLAIYLNSDQGRKNLLSMISGVAITRLTLTKLNLAQIPLPPISTQRAIVTEIEAEQKLVDSNRELIARFEKKIQAVLARVWGESDEKKEEQK